MTDAFYIELMHKAIDGEITKKEKSLLDKFLSDNPESERYYRELKLAGQSINNIPVIDPPASLKDDILHQIDKELYSVNKSLLHKPGIIDFKFGGKKLRTAFALAAGLIIGFVLYPLIILSPGSDQEPGIKSIYGTIGLTDSRGIQKIKSFNIDQNHVVGHIDLKQKDKLIWLEFYLESSQGIKTHINYETYSLDLISFQPLDPKPVNFYHSENNIIIDTSHPFILLFNHKSGQPTFIDVSVIFGKKSVQKIQFEVKQLIK